MTLDQNTLDYVIRLIPIVISACGVIAIYYQTRKHHFDIKFNKLDASERISKLASALGDEHLIRIDKEAMKDEVFYYRTNIECKGKLRRAFMKEYEELTDHLGIGLIYTIRSYFLVTDQGLEIQSAKKILTESIIIFFFFGMMFLLFLSLLILTYFVESPASSFMSFLASILSVLTWLPIARQIVLLQFLSKARAYFKARKGQVFEANS